MTVNKSEALKLRLGDRVVIWRGQEGQCAGTVIVKSDGTSWIRIAWDDGEHTGIHPADMINVEREE